MSGPAEGREEEPDRPGRGGGNGADDRVQAPRRKPADPAPDVLERARPGPVRRLYDWVLHWAETPYGPMALFVLALAESSFFPIPPDPLLLALALGQPSRALRFAAIATGASVVGGALGYGIGAVGWQAMEPFFMAYVPGVSPESFARVQALYERYDFWAVFVAGLTPIPYKVFTIAAGVFAINFPVFILASFASRGLRFFAEGFLIHHFGEPVAEFIDKYFDLLTLAFGALLVGGFLLIEFVL